MCLLVNSFIARSRRLGLLSSVNLVPNLLTVHRIAFFGENVYILYVAEMAQDSGLAAMILELSGTERGQVSTFDK